MIDTALIDAARILDGSPVPTFVIDASHVVVYWNEALARISKVPAAEVLGTHHQWRAFYPAHRPVMADLVVDGSDLSLIEKFYRGRYRRSPHNPDAWESEDFFPHFGETGRWLAFSAAPIRNADGRIVGCVETLQDISERKEAELARREAERRLNEIVAGSPVATFVIDTQCRVTHWNRACEALTGVSKEEMMGRDDVWRAFYPYETRRVVLAEMIVRGAREKEVSERYTGHARPSKLVPDAFEARDFFPSFGPQGQWLHFMAAPLHNLAGDVVGAIETLVELGGEAPAAS
ncbi:MAG: PAS domain-containing protein [Rhodocyclales bacterium]|nr:PAS domain-containing protein [Rhodocyclales bacterium]